MDELEGGAGVVVQAAHQLLVVLEGDAGGGQQLADLLVVLLARLAQVVAQHGGADELLLHVLALVVEHAQRVDLDPATGVLVQVQVAQEGLEGVPVGGAALLVAERVQQQAEVLQAERLVGVDGQDDQLGVQGRVLGADGLGTDLREVAVAAGLGTLVAVVRAGVPELDGEVARLVEVGLERGAQHGGGALGAQRELLLAALGEGVHLLGDDVGGLADAAGEQLDLLEAGGFDVAVAGPLERRGDGLADGEVDRGVGRGQVVGALGGLEGAHGNSRHIPRRGAGDPAPRPAATSRR